MTSYNCYNFFHHKRKFEQSNLIENVWLKTIGDTWLELEAWLAMAEICEQLEVPRDALIPW